MGMGRGPLQRAREYWIATTRPDGAPHCRPVWGVWLDDGYWFSDVHDNGGMGGPAYRVMPHRVFGWDQDMTSPTRWSFEA